jgi:hypothetical protein
MLLTLSQQQNLVSRGLATQKINGDLITFKYHRKVMYDYLWKQEPQMLECRGHTYDLNTGEIVLAAPTKTFNYLEDNWWGDVDLDTGVTAYKKYNGFMGTMAIHNGDFVFGTTGTTNSDYAKMFREEFFRNYDSDTERWGDYYTWLFEVLHENDPHIVDETPGLVYLGNRVNSNGNFYPAISNRNENDVWYPNTTLGTMLEIVKQVKHEGFMLYTDDGRVCKLKSPYYVGKKKLMRAKDKLITELWNEKGLDNLPKMWHPIVSKLIRDVWEADWRAMPEQDRRKVLESYFN